MTPLGMEVLLAVEPVDMRCSFDGLARWAHTHLQRDAAGEKAMFVFVNRRRDMLKALWRDSTGWCLLSKRLDTRVVAIPDNIPKDAKSITVDAQTLAELLDGVVKRRQQTARDIVRASRAALENISSTQNNTVNATIHETPMTT